VTASPTCPRCGGHLAPPGLWSSDWQCDRDGAVQPLHIHAPADQRALDHVAALARVPLWVPRPLLFGWVISGVGYAGDERGGARATVLSCSGPSPVGGPADLALVAEEPGVGLGARLGGVADSAPNLPGGPAEMKVHAAHHPTALWAIEGADDRVTYIGEARGIWLWVVLRPASAYVLLIDSLKLHDLRDGVFASLDLVFGAASPMLVGLQGPCRDAP